MAANFAEPVQMRIPPATNSVQVFAAAINLLAASSTLLLPCSQLPFFPDVSVSHA